MVNGIDIQKIGEGRYLIDVCGKVCPYPELFTLRALHNLNPGDVLEVILDNPPSVRDIPLSLEKRGYGTPEVSKTDKGAWKIIVRVSE